MSSNMIKSKQIDTSAGFSVSGSLSLEGATPNRLLHTANSGGVVEASTFLKVDGVNNRLGIGTLTPLSTLDLTGDTAGEAQVLIRQHNNSTDGPDLTFNRSRGTESSKLAVSAGDAVGRVNAEAYTSSGLQLCGRYGWTASDSNANTTFELSTRVSGTFDKRLELIDTGALKVSNAYTLPLTDGSAGDVLTTDGAGAVSWSSAGGGGSGGPSSHIDGATFTADATISAPSNGITEIFRLCTASSGDHVLTLPSASGLTDGLKVIVKGSVNGANVQVTPASGDDLDGTTDATKELFGGASVTLVVWGGAWYTIGSSY